MNKDQNMKKKKEDWNLDHHDTTPYGNSLAASVADKLFKGYPLIYTHRDYCGMGFAYEDGQFIYTTVYDGYVYEIQETFESKTDFVQWLSRQSDKTMAGIELNDTWYQDNQRITLSRLNEFVK